MLFVVLPIRFVTWLNTMYVQIQLAIELHVKQDGKIFSMWKRCGKVLEVWSQSLTSTRPYCGNGKFYYLNSSDDTTPDGQQHFWLTDILLRLHNATFMIFRLRERARTVLVRFLRSVLGVMKKTKKWWKGMRFTF
jgi:hypothetical protein